MVLLQVLTASEKKGSVLSRFKRILCHSFLLATFVLRTRNKKKKKAKRSCLVSGSHPSALILQPLRDVQLAPRCCNCGFTFELR